MLFRLGVTIFLLLCFNPRGADALSLIDFPSLLFEAGQPGATNELNPHQVSQFEETIDTLKRNPSLGILITGHADSTEGSDQECLAISEQRARLVYNWLLAHGTNAVQLIGHKGFGKTQLVDFSETEAQRRHNRRVELNVQYEH